MVLSWAHYYSLFYLIDISLSSKVFKLIVYADDTKLFASAIESTGKQIIT